MKKIILFLILTSSIQAQIIISKKSHNSDPTLYIQTFSQNPTLTKKLKYLLSFTAWFTISKDIKSSDYILTILKFRGKSIDIHIEDAYANNIVTYRQETTSIDINMLMRASIDTMIKKIFGANAIYNSKLVFVTDSTGHKEIYTSYIDDFHKMRQISNNKGISVEPNWGKSKKNLLYTVYDIDGTSIIYVDLIKNRLKRISSYKGMNSLARFSPSGKYITVILSKDKQIDLYIKGINSKELYRLTNDSAVESSPVWSPDGQKICYVSNKYGRPALFIKAIKAGKAKRITPLYNESVSPNWSAISNKLCFSLKTGNTYSIATINPDDSNSQKIITSLAGNWEAPAWAPDGRHIVCSRTLNKKTSLYIVDSKSKHIKRISHGKTANYSLPDW